MYHMLFAICRCNACTLLLTFLPFHLLLLLEQFVIVMLNCAVQFGLLALAFLCTRSQCQSAQDSKDTQLHNNCNEDVVMHLSVERKQDAPYRI